MSYRYIVIVLLLMLTVAGLAQDSIATQILEQTNTARAERGIARLQFNTQLQQTAQQHSDDMAQVDQLSHTGSDGSQFWERMQQNDYLLTAGAENILSRGDTNATAAYQQWFNSTPHRNNLLNGDYVEVGIAYARAESGRFYFTMVLGAQTDFVPASPTPIPTRIIPTITPVAPTPLPTMTPLPTLTTLPTIAPTNTLQPAATATQSAPRAIVTNTPYPTATDYVAPDLRLLYADDSFLLINVSGRVLNLANLVFESTSGVMASSRWNSDFLSQPLSGFTSGDCLQAWTLTVDFLPNPPECRYRHAWVTVTDDTVFWRNADFFTVRNGENLIGICRADAGLCDVSLSTQITDLAVVDPVTFGALPDIRLEYPDSSFSLINISGRRLDLSDLVFRSESGTLRIEQWNNEFLSSPLSNFAISGCLQAWTPDYPQQTPPDRCDVRHAWILVNDSGDFWRQTDSFTVERNGTLIGRCRTDTTICNLSLASDFGILSQPSATAQTTRVTDTPIISTTDVQLIISNLSVTLLNTSANTVNIASMVFESDSGTFASSQWEIPQMSVPLAGLPAGDCVQVWAVGTEIQLKPAGCNVRHAWVATLPGEQFWLTETAFDVYRIGILAARCDARVTTCNFDLP